jgi:hypothetical protein
MFHDAQSQEPKTQLVLQTPRKLVCNVKIKRGMVGENVEGHWQEKG